MSASGKCGMLIQTVATSTNTMNADMNKSHQTPKFEKIRFLGSSKTTDNFINKVSTRASFSTFDKNCNCSCPFTSKLVAIGPFSGCFGSKKHGKYESGKSPRKRKIS